MIFLFQLILVLLGRPTRARRQVRLLELTSSSPSVASNHLSSTTIRWFDFFVWSFSSLNQLFLYSNLNHLSSTTISDNIWLLIISSFLLSDNFFYSHSKPPVKHNKGVIRWALQSVINSMLPPSAFVTKSNANDANIVAKSIWTLD